MHRQHGQQVVQAKVTSGLFGIVEAARELGGISPWSLRKQIFQGNVQVTRLGRRVFLRGEEIERIQREGLPSLRSSVPACERK